MASEMSCEPIAVEYRSSSPIAAARRTASRACSTASDEPLAQAEEVSRDALVREAEDGWIAVRLGDRSLEELDGRTDVVVVAIAAAPGSGAPEHAPALAEARRRPRRAARAPGGYRRRRSSGRPPRRHGGRARPRGRAASALAPPRGTPPRRSALRAPSEPRRLVQHCGDLGVGTVGCQSQMPRALLEVAQRARRGAHGRRAESAGSAAASAAAARSGWANWIRPAPTATTSVATAGPSAVAASSPVAAWTS